MLLTIISINVHSLIPRIHEVRRICSAQTPHVVCIQETWLCGMIADNCVSVNGYRTLRADRADQSGYGGVITYIRSDVSYEELSVELDNAYEAIWISITTTTSKVVVANVYRPPSFSLGSFISSLNRAIAHRHSFVLIGDFNVNSRYSHAFRTF